MVAIVTLMSTTRNRARMAISPDARPRMPLASSCAAPFALCRWSARRPFVELPARHAARYHHAS
ncbi:hypothetical protein BDV95DRAFT_349932 [Massariosphaeria phaeospora]|uniref:Uncharacterized protein n=1 Tax=Massariosphaeria phaeospora TaxID=100035 RepID=A0A7C8IGI2_9PLEO|nr:hypothetical protein BDV95DRAFT_349932 [Massariosphaeria phaeospora]